MSDETRVEEWRAVVEAPGYEVSDQGRVRSYWRNWGLRREAPAPRKVEVRHGRVHVTLRVARGVRKVKQLHRLVLAAFAGPCPPGFVGCHNDGNPLNNRLDNLRWDTQKNNQADREKHGTMLRGERHPNAKLLDADTDLIRTLLRRGFTARRVGELFGVCTHTVWNARDRDLKPRIARIGANEREGEGGRRA